MVEAAEKKVLLTTHKVPGCQVMVLEGDKPNEVIVATSIPGETQRWPAISLIMNGHKGSWAEDKDPAKDSEAARQGIIKRLSGHNPTVTSSLEGAMILSYAVPYDAAAESLTEIARRAQNEMVLGIEDARISMGAPPRGAGNGTAASV